MSYLNQLQNLQGDIRARAEHASDVASNIDARKASTIEEKLNSVKDNVELGLNATTGISGAYHAGRKLYKKYVQKQAPKKAEAEEDPAEATESGEAAEGTTPAAPTEATPAPSDPAAATDSNPSIPAESDLPPPGSEIEMQNMADVGVNSSEGASATEGAEATEATTGSDGLAGLGYTEEDAAQLLGDGPSTAASSATESATASSADGAGSAIPEAKAGTDAPDAADGLSSAEGSAATETGQAAATETATDTAVSAGTEAAEGTAATVLETGLDFLGPVGLAVGAIGALFEAIFGGKSAAEKAKEAKEKEEQANIQTASTTSAGGALASGIDPKALASA